MKKIRNGWWTVAGIIIAVCLATSIPFLYGYFKTPPGKVFTGLSSLNTVDTYSYISWMEQAKEGKVLFTDLYTTETQKVGLFNPLFLGMGLVNRALDLPNILFYHICRVLAGAVFLIVIYYFTSLFVTETRKRLAVLLIIAFSSGLGWLFGPRSTDMTSVETITFLSLYNSVLNPISLSLMLGVFSIAMKKFNSIRIAWIVGAALLLNLLVLIHPYDVVIVASVLGGYGLLQWVLYREKKVFVSVVLLGLLTLPAVLWQYHSLYGNYVFTVWATQQTNVKSPPFYYYLAGYGLLLIFAFKEFLESMLKKNTTNLFLYVWIFVVGILLYFPFLARFQLKFSEGLHIPIAVLAGLGIMTMLNQRKTVFKKGVVLFLLILILPLSNVLAVAHDMYLFASAREPYYIQTGDRDALVWLKNHHTSQDILLTSEGLGNFVPGISGTKVFIGHTDQTVNFLEKRKIVATLLYSGSDDPVVLQDFIARNGITLLLIKKYTPLFKHIPLSEQPFLRLIYETDSRAIYKVT